MMSVQAFARDYIRQWEDGGSDDPRHTLSLDRNDPGNWTGGACNKGTLVGSQHGVTPHALAAYRNCPVDTITQEVMRAVTLDEAASIAVKDYYQAPRFSSLPWDQVAASLMDFGWNAGPRQATRILQRTIGVADDGAIGPNTVHAYEQWIARLGLEAAAREWARQRNAYYQSLVDHNAKNAKYLNGWKNRTAAYAPGSAWWTRFQATA